MYNEGGALALDSGLHVHLAQLGMSDCGSVLVRDCVRNRVQEVPTEHV